MYTVDAMVLGSSNDTVDMMHLVIVIIIYTVDVMALGIFLKLFFFFFFCILPVKICNL